METSVESAFFVLYGSLASATRFAYGSLRKGQITVLRAAVDDDAMLELALNAGAANAAYGHEGHEHRLIASTVVTKRLSAACQAFSNLSEGTDFPKLTYIPKTTV